MKTSSPVTGTAPVDQFAAVSQCLGPADGVVALRVNVWLSADEPSASVVETDTVNGLPGRSAVRVSAPPEVAAALISANSGYRAADRAFQAEAKAVASVARVVVTAE